MAKTTKRSTVVALSDDCVRAVDRRVSRKRGKSPVPSRAAVLDALVRSCVMDPSEVTKKSGGRDPARAALLEGARRHKDEARKRQEAGDRKAATEHLLLAASKEIRALAFDPSPCESDIKSTLLEAMLLLREATGYRRLPDLPDPGRRSDAVQ